LKSKINGGGVIDSNGSIFHFLLPSLFAAIFSAILAGIGESAAVASVLSNNTVSTVSFAINKEANRGNSAQGGYQIGGWLISIGIGAFTGILVGICYWLLD
jgi:hypothetical protein